MPILGVSPILFRILFINFAKSKIIFRFTKEIFDMLKTEIRGILDE